MILGLGMSLVDQFHVVDEFPGGPGVSEVKERRIMGGGPVPTALCAAARLGSPAAVIDRVGDDWCGRFVQREYEAFGVDTSHLALEEGRGTTFANVLVRKSDGERHVVFAPGDFTPLAEEELPTDALRHADFLHLNGRHWPACLRAAELVRGAGGKVSFDGGAGRFQEKFTEILPLVDILVVAADFADQLTGLPAGDRDAQLRALSRWGADVAGITDGARGSWFLCGARASGESFAQPAFPVERIVDTTGCGDVFHGAFLHARHQGQSWRDCARFASAAAALSATALGGRGYLPGPEEVAALMK